MTEEELTKLYKQGDEALKVVEEVKKELAGYNRLKDLILDDQFEHLDDLKMYIREYLL